MNDVTIGKKTRIFSGVLIYGVCLVGEVVFSTLARLSGLTGLDAWKLMGLLVEIPQVRRVRISNRVEIGANRTIGHLRLRLSVFKYEGRAMVEEYLVPEATHPAMLMDD